MNGDNYIGGIAAYNYGTIDNCTVTGTISGEGWVGGIAGQNNENGVIRYSSSAATIECTASNIGGIVGDNTGTVSFCFSTGNVSGRDSVGGIVGFTAGFTGSGTIEDTYSTGNILGNIGVGGIAGSVNGAAVRRSYATGSVSGVNSVGGIAGSANSASSTDACVSLNTSVTRTTGNNSGRVEGTEPGSNLSRNYARADILINGSLVTDGTVTNLNGANITSTNYATLWAVLDFNDPWWFGRLPNLSVYYDGTSTIRVTNENELRQVGRGASGYETWTLSADYVLMNNITLTSDWVAIGAHSDGQRFTGSFDGNGFTVSGLNINSIGYQGFFSAVQGGTIENLNLFGDVHSAGITGGITANLINNGTIRNCTFTGDVTSESRVGGLVATLSGGSTIDRCIFNGFVSTTANHAGGIVGFMGWDDGGNSIVKNCLSVGRVESNGAAVADTGDSGAGGIVGGLQRAGGTVINNISVAEVSRIHSSGGIVGHAGFFQSWQGIEFNVNTRVHNNIALNTSITAANANHIGRIAGRMETTSNTDRLQSNYAWAAITINGSTITNGEAGNINGADIIGDNIVAIRALFTDPWWNSRFPDLTPYLIFGSSLELDECLFCGFDFDECICPELCPECWIDLEECECECFLCTGLGECECTDDNECIECDDSGYSNSDCEYTASEESEDSFLELVIILPVVSLGEFLRRRKILRIPRFKRIFSSKGKRTDRINT